MAAIACFGNSIAGSAASSSGPWIAFAECAGSTTSQIVVARPDGADRHAITANSAPSWFPAWSPSGNQVAYVYEAPSGLQIWTMNADGSANHAVTTIGNSLAPSWSHDGRRIAFAHASGAPADFKIWVMDADGANARQVTNSSSPTIDENVPRWSPDDHRLVYTSNERVRYEIWVTDVATGADRRPLTTSYYDASLRADIEQKVPAWSPDGTKIVYWSGVEGNDPRPGLPRDVWIMDADGSAQRRLVAGDDPNWSPDGATVIFSTATGILPAIGAVLPNGDSARTLFNVRACRSLQSSWVVRGATP
jgi:Tol biopolymer transport system component